GPLSVGFGEVSTTAQYVFSTAPSRNCSLSRAAALLVRANRSDPLTGLSSRWTTPRNTLPGFLCFSLRYDFARRSTVSSRPSKWVVGRPAGLLSDRQWWS